MSAIVLRADARALPLPDASVDLIVTSPPYFGLRSYTDGGEHYDGQIGAEPTPAGYVAALVDCTREWMRVLKPAGSLFVNLGDSYYSGKGAPGRTTTDPKNAGRDARRTQRSPLDYGLDLPRKTLLGLPWRYALACTDQLGLILRAEIIWAKPNGLPESVTDRVRRSHETWFHLVRQPRYYSAVDEIREPASGYFRQDAARAAAPGTKPRTMADTCNPLGKLPGSVWTIPTQPLTVPPHLNVDHFAAFPMEWPRRIITGWSPPGICTACGEARRPVMHRVTTGHDNRLQSRGEGRRDQAQNRTPYNSSATYWAWKAANGGDRITGYACACPTPDAPTRPAVVVDPFGGTGTTALLAGVLGRTGISADKSADYCRLARWRTTDPCERARAMQVDKPPAQAIGQATFDDLDELTAAMPP